MDDETKIIADINGCGANDTAKMVGLFQSYLEQLLSAVNATWMAAYKRPFGRSYWFVELMDNWKVVDTIFPVQMDKSFVDEHKKYFKQAIELGGIDPQVTYSIQHAGKTRVARLEDAVSLEEWQQHWMCKRLQDEGVVERMVGTFTLSEFAESYITIDRPIGQSGFSVEDAEHFYKAMTLFPQMHYWLFLERGLVAPALRPLSPRQQVVLRYLLGSLAEQEIADALELSKSTLHNYVLDIYKNYEVTSRYELVGLWLKGMAN